jgi:hypothetical protein
MFVNGASARHWRLAPREPSAERFARLFRNEAA